MPTQADCAQILATHPHDPSITAILLQQRLTNGMPLAQALTIPRGKAPRIKRWPHIAVAIAHYLARTERHS